MSPDLEYSISMACTIALSPPPTSSAEISSASWAVTGSSSLARSISDDVASPPLSASPFEVSSESEGSDSDGVSVGRSEEHTSESSHVAISYAVFCLKKKKKKNKQR